MIHAIPTAIFTAQNAGAKKSRHGGTQTRRGQKKSVSKVECAIQKHLENGQMNGTKKIMPGILHTWPNEGKRTLCKSFRANYNQPLELPSQNTTHFSLAKKAHVQSAINLQIKTKSVSLSIIATTQKKSVGFFAQPAIKESVFSKTM